MCVCMSVQGVCVCVRECACPYLSAGILQWPSYFLSKSLKTGPEEIEFNFLGRRINGKLEK